MFRRFIEHPLTQQRLKRFRTNRVAVWASRFFVLIIIVCAFAPLIANDKPLIVHYKNQWFFPIWHNPSSVVFGDIFDSPTNYTDPFILDEIKQHGFLIKPIVHYYYTSIDTTLKIPTPTPPDGQHWLGTDDMGRDVIARLIYGSRVSLIFGFALTFASAIIGIGLGVVQGYRAGLIDLIGQRLIEIWQGMPTLFMLIIMSSFIEPSVFWLFILMLLFNWTGFVGVVRAESLKTRNFEYILSARALGVRSKTIMLRHVLPNALVATMTLMPWALVGAIMSLTALDFLGFGLPPGSASLGEMMTQAKANLHASWLGFSIFFTLFILMATLVFIGDGIRDAMDPRANTES